MAVWQSASVCRRAKPRRARRVTALLDWNGTLNAERKKVSPTPHFRFDAMNVRGQGVARAFDERLLLFSRQQTFGPSVATTHLHVGSSMSSPVMHGRLLRGHNASKMPFKRPSRSSAGGSLERAEMHFTYEFVPSRFGRFLFVWLRAAILLSAKATAKLTPR